MERDLGLALVPAYTPAAWHAFFGMLGGAGATLTGLLFIAFSLRVADLQRSVIIRARARYLLLGMVMITAASGFVLLPEQPLWALSLEIVAVTVVYMTYTVASLVYATRREPLNLTADLAARYVTLAVIMLLCWASGASLVLRAGGGLYLLAIALLLAMAVEVLAAWSLIIGIGRDNRPVLGPEPMVEAADTDQLQTSRSTTVTRAG